MLSKNIKIFMCKDEEEMIFVIDTLKSNIPDLKLMKDTSQAKRYYSDNEDCYYYIQTYAYHKVRVGTLTNVIVYRGNVGWNTIEESDNL